jgi:hypothetical protein
VNLGGETKCLEGKVRNKMITLTLSTLVLALLPTLNAQAIDLEYCKQYAQAAISQVSVGRANPTCAAGMKGARWSPTLRVHLVYCMSHPIAATENLQGVRDNYLHSCGAK